MMTSSTIFTLVLRKYLPSSSIFCESFSLLLTKGYLSHIFSGIISSRDFISTMDGGIILSGTTNLLVHRVDFLGGSFSLSDIFIFDSSSSKRDSKWVFMPCSLMAFCLGGYFF